jgi:hypothetical protein
MPVSHLNNIAAAIKPAPRFSAKRVAGGIAIAAALALAFIGYLSPYMQVQWANFVTFCGF